MARGEWGDDALINLVSIHLSPFAIPHSPFAMHIGIFGGSFNPPHVGHQIVAERVREAFELDRVLWIPNRMPPHKPGANLAAAAHRLEMTRLATADHPGFAVSDVELHREGPSFTVDTVCLLQTSQPEDTFALIVGGDSLRDFGSWYRPDEIARRVSLLVYRRPGVVAGPLPDYLEGRVRFADAPLLDVSSTDIRERCRDGRSIRYLVPEAVRQYIAQHRLYHPAETAA